MSSKLWLISGCCVDVCVLDGLIIQRKQNASLDYRSYIHIHTDGEKLPAHRLHRVNVATEFSQRPNVILQRMWHSADTLKIFFPPFAPKPHPISCLTMFSGECIVPHQNHCHLISPQREPTIMSCKRNQVLGGEGDATWVLLKKNQNRLWINQAWFD